jgi:hypothetical protein
VKTKILIRQEWTKFVLENIMRPYQNMLGFEQRFEKYDYEFYHSIRQFASKCPEWADAVFSRLAQIYDYVDPDFFPPSPTRDYIMEELAKHGVDLKF